MFAMFRAAVALLATLFLATGSGAQAKPVAAPGGYVPQTSVAFGAEGGAATGVNAANPLPISCISGCSGGAASSFTAVVTSAAASSLVAKASAGDLYGFTANATVAGYFMVYNATAAPADGAVTPIDCIPYPASGQALGVDYSGAPLRGGTGLTIGFSTTGCFTKTASVTAFISAKVQ